MLKRIASFALCLAMGGLLAASPAEAKGFKNLTFMGSYMERHPVVLKVWKPLFQAAEQKFGGNLTFDYYASNILYPDSEGPQAIADGRVDFGCFLPSVYPGRFNLLGVVNLPGMAPDAITGSLLAEELVQKFPEIRKEMPANSVHFTSWTSAAYQVHTIKPAKSLEDLKGRKIIAWDSVCLELLKALGVNAVRVKAPDSYIALSKGMADGIVCPLAPLRSFKISEVTTHHLMLDVFVQNFSMEANKDLWDAMPQDMQAFLSTEGGVKAALAVGKALEDGVKADTDWMKAQGHQFYELSDADRSLLLEKTGGFVEAWRNECRNFDPTLVDSVYQFARERSAAIAAEVRAGKYGEYR